MIGLLGDEDSVFQAEGSRSFSGQVHTAGCACILFTLRKLKNRCESSCFLVTPLNAVPSLFTSVNFQFTEPSLVHLLVFGFGTCSGFSSHNGLVAWYFPSKPSRQFDELVFTRHVLLLCRGNNNDCCNNPQSTYAKQPLISLLDSDKSFMVFLEPNGAY